ncbi:MAG: hypothetical protein ABH896_04940 [Candidatus Jacksonbacteria bacterium]
MKKDYPQPVQSQKIPFWRRRWFWGGILGIILGIIIAFIVSLNSSSHTLLLFFFNASDTNFFLIIAEGFLICLITIIRLLSFGKLFTLPATITKSEITILDTVPKTIAISVYVIYYLLLLFLIYKTFRYKKVKIKYPILFISIFLPSFLAGVILTILRAAF